jgi:hypothetical protein
MVGSIESLLGPKRSEQALDRELREMLKLPIDGVDCRFREFAAEIVDVVNFGFRAKMVNE